MIALATSPAKATDHAGHLKLEREHSFEVPLPPAEAFTLFEPIGEKRWAADWQPVFASSADVLLHNGSVFTVDRPSPHGGAPVRSVWTVTRYETPSLIEYHNVLIGVRATRITVRLTEAQPTHTRVTVRYVYTGLSPEGDEAIRQITPEGYRQMIDSWGTEIAAYLQRGTPASP